LADIHADIFWDGIFPWRLSTQNAPDVQVASRPYSASVSVQIAGADVDQPLRNFASNFNEYVHDQNRTSRLANLAAMFGYILAALTSIVSFLLERASLDPAARHSR
jgi:hypothetical protein